MGDVRVQKDLTCTQGGNFFYSAGFTNADPSGLNVPTHKTYLNLTGCGIRMTVRFGQTYGGADRTSATLIAMTLGGGLAFIPVTDPDIGAAPGFNNGFSATIPPLTTLTFTPGEYYYDVFIDFPGAPTDSEPWMAGKFLVLGTGT